VRHTLARAKGSEYRERSWLELLKDYAVAQDFTVAQE
jgi:hypothetical protein